MALSELEDRISSNANPAPEQDVQKKNILSTSTPLETSDEKCHESSNADAASEPPSDGQQQPQWNRPRINMWRTFAAFMSLFIMGCNDAVYGLEIYYHQSYTTISLIFLSPLVGYATSALLINTIHTRYGQRGVAFLGPGTRLIAYIVIALHPPYPVLVVAFMLAGFGTGLEDGAWNAMIGPMKNANQVLGFLHGFYGLGGVVAPLVSTTMITTGHLPWYDWYYLMIGVQTLHMGFAVAAFWARNGAQYRASLLHSQPGPDSNEKGGRLQEALRNKVTWICAVFLLIAVGIEVSISGWVVTYSLRVRHAGPFAAGMSSVAFWAGLTVGRVVLGFVTPRIGERLAIFVYLASSVVAHLVFWLVPVYPVSATGVAFLGAFIGPFFPAAVAAAAKLLPTHLHVGGVGFIAAFGAAGACVLPFAVGGIAQARGVQTLMPIVLAMLVADAVVWALLPSLKGKPPGSKAEARREEDEVEEVEKADGG
ncbi:MAG: hypothetical protein Q9191_000511 [Dirinaria sp. TL-2023a]